MTAFAVATSLSLFYPTLIIGLLFCALSIAASRILLGCTSSAMWWPAH